MRRSLIGTCVLITAAVLGMTSQMNAGHPPADFGTFVQSQLANHSEQLFGIRHPLEESALGPYDGSDNLKAIQVAPGLNVSLVSSSVASAADQIAMWPDDDNPRYLFVCDEETTDPAVQRGTRTATGAGWRIRKGKRASVGSQCNALRSGIRFIDAVASQLCCARGPDSWWPHRSNVNEREVSI